MSFLEKMLGGLVPAAPARVETREFRGVPVGWSADMARILALPRRKLDPDDPRAAEAWTKHLRLERTTPCDCKSRWPNGCIEALQPIQGWALEEAMDAGGLVASIAVGGGKTGIDILLPMAIPGVKTAVLCVPPGLKSQLLTRDFPQWSQHFKVPNLAGGGSFIEGRPVLHVLSYNEISNPKNSDLFRKIGPIDLAIEDEWQNLADRKTARTVRWFRIWELNPKCKNAMQSGTLTKKSPKEYAHGAALALGDGCPVPLEHHTLDEWSTVLDASPFVAPTGLFAKFCEPAESPRSGYRRRLIETPGVVATAENRLEMSLTINERIPGPVPADVAKAIEETERDSVRPDGEELVEALQVETASRQLAAGFFYRWRFVHGETMEQIDAWLKARKAFFKELRLELKKPRENYDSPKLLCKAAIRWHEGYTFIERDAEGVIVKKHEIPPHSPRGPLPTWQAEFWPAWYAIHKTVRPETEPVWINDFLVRDAAAWLRDTKEGTGIAWYEFTEFGRAVARLADVEYYGGGPEASEKIILETGKRSIVASIKAHGTGKNLQYGFWRNLVMNPPSDGACWEQLIGRTHRQGQPHDEVTVDLYRHTARWQKAFDTACERAWYIQDTLGTAQKLCYATYSFNRSR